MPRPLLLLQVIAARVVEHEPIRVVVQLYERTRRVTLLLTAAARGKHEPRISSEIRGPDAEGLLLYRGQCQAPAS
jgi:hypothetical protein